MPRAFRPIEEDGGWSGAAARGPDGEAAHRVAHDFRNMLQIAMSAVRVTRRQLLDLSEAELAATLHVALGALDRANLLAHRLDRRAPAQATKPVLLQTFVPGLAALMRRALGDRIRLETLVAEDLPPVPCDRHQLENALINLAVNARDAMPGGGRLWTEALRCARHARTGCVALSVIDDGPGMPPEVAAKAFEPCFTTKRSKGGSGIGLHNVRLFAEGLGGSAELLSTPGAGTRIRLHLPTG